MTQKNLHSAEEDRCIRNKVIHVIIQNCTSYDTCKVKKQILFLRKTPQGVTFRTNFGIYVDVFYVGKEGIPSRKN